MGCSVFSVDLCHNGQCFNGLIYGSIQRYFRKLFYSKELGMQLCLSIQFYFLNYYYIS